MSPVQDAGPEAYEVKGGVSAVSFACMLHGLA